MSSRISEEWGREWEARKARCREVLLDHGWKQEYPNSPGIFRRGEHSPVRVKVEGDLVWVETVAQHDLGPSQVCSIGLEDPLAFTLLGLLLDIFAYRFETLEGEALADLKARLR